MARYTPTYTSNAFAHASYEAPLKTTESAAVRTLKTTGTSVEDYGRRNQKFDKDAFLSAVTAGRPSTAATSYKREVVIEDDPNCAHCTNHSMATHKQVVTEQEKKSTLTFEKLRQAMVHKKEADEIARRRAEKEANQQEMSATLRQIEERKRAEWDAKKNDRTNWEATQRLQQETREISERAQQERQIGKESYKDELNRKREEAIHLNIIGKINDRELERRLNGLTFECYERDPKMKEETKKAGQVVKSQINEVEGRKKQEKDEFIRPPEVFYTDKELQALRQEAELRQREVRSQFVDNAKTQLNQHFTRKSQEREQKVRTIEEEREIHARMRELAAQEKDFQRRTREQRQQEMNGTLSSLEEQKRAEWESKKNDKTNKIQTEQLHQQISEMTKANLEDHLRQKQGYFQDLSTLTAAQRQKLESDFLQSRAEEERSKGFKFECYQRDPKMKREKVETGKFLKNQKEIEVVKKQVEVDQLKAAPPSLMTTEHLQALQQEAVSQDIERRVGLKSIMQSQYRETIAEREARVAGEKQRDAELAAATAARNAEIARQEKEIRESTKVSYGSYLNYQLTDAEQRKQQEEAERKYDPNVERLIQENASIKERIVKCGKCCGTLSHERTHTDHRANHI